MNKEAVLDGAKEVLKKALPLAKSLGKTAVHAAVYSAVFKKVADWIESRKTKTDEEK